MWGSGVSLLVDLATVLTVPSPLSQVPSALPAVTGRSGTTHPHRGYLPGKDHSPAMTTLGDTNNSGWMGASGRWVGRGGDLVLPRHHRSVAFPGFLLAAGKHSDPSGPALQTGQGRILGTTPEPLSAGNPGQVPSSKLGGEMAQACMGILICQSWVSPGEQGKMLGGSLQNGAKTRATHSTSRTAGGG